MIKSHKLLHKTTMTSISQHMIASSVSSTYHAFNQLCIHSHSSSNYLGQKENVVQKGSTKILVAHLQLNPFMPGFSWKVVKIYDTFSDNLIDTHCE